MTGSSFLLNLLCWLEDFLAYQNEDLSWAVVRFRSTVTVFNFTGSGLIFSLVGVCLGELSTFCILIVGNRLI